MIARFSTLMERAEVMTALRSGEQATFPQEFEDRVPENAKKVRQTSFSLHCSLYFMASMIRDVTLLSILK